VHGWSGSGTGRQSQRAEGRSGSRSRAAQRTGPSSAAPLTDPLPLPAPSARCRQRTNRSGGYSVLAAAVAVTAAVCSGPAAAALLAAVARSQWSLFAGRSHSAGSSGGSRCAPLCSRAVIHARMANALVGLSASQCVTSVCPSPFPLRAWHRESVPSRSEIEQRFKGGCARVSQGGADRGWRTKH
jgi:hypothetical protein